MGAIMNNYVIKDAFFLFVLTLLCTTPVVAKVSMRGKTASIQVASGATLNIKNPIASFDGTLLKSIGATVSGSPITFSNDIWQAVNAINNNLGAFQGVLKQLITVQTKADTSTGIFFRTYDTQTIQIAGTTQFTSAMLPTAYQTVVLEFPQYYDSNNIPELIFNNVGTVELPYGSRLIISGTGIVEMVGTTSIIFNGTPAPTATARGIDWSAFNLEQGALMHLAQGASVIVGAGAASSYAGSFNLYNNATLLLDTSSTLVLGGATRNQLMVNVDALSTIQLNHPQAQMSVCAGIFDFSFKRHSALNINNGTLEINTQAVAGVITPQSATIRSLAFTDGSSLLVQSIGSNNGLLRVAPNISDATTNFDNTTGIIQGYGQMELITFNPDTTIATNVTANLSGSKGSGAYTMENLFTLLTT
jgi:hypothetical protein